MLQMTAAIVNHKVSTELEDALLNHAATPFCHSLVVTLLWISLYQWTDSTGDSHDTYLHHEVSTQFGDVLGLHVDSVAQCRHALHQLLKVKAKVNTSLRYLAPFLITLMMVMIIS